MKYQNQDDRRAPTRRLDERAEYCMMGEEGYYYFSDTWANLARMIGDLEVIGFTLIGINGVNGFKCSAEAV